MLWIERLENLARQFEDLGVMLADPLNVSNPEIYNKLAKERSEMEGVVEAFRLYRCAVVELDEARLMLKEGDEELRELAKEEVDSLEGRISVLEKELQLMLLPKDPMDTKNVVLEIRAGTGGDEASLFAGDLFGMYCRYASKMGWRVEMISASEGTQGGFKEVVAIISGERVYSRMKFEAGTHRVQRVPVTESQGRIHTSACTVAILPEADDVDVKFAESDLRIDTYRASGAGGQHVNKTDSAVRITHIPTGIVVACQDERSQHKNKAKALKVLQSRLMDAERIKSQSERAASRKSMVGSGDRSERIRTYNFPQNRITDHRINLTIYSLDTMLETGEIDDLVDALRSAEQLSLMEESGM